MFRRLLAIAALCGVAFLLTACESAPPPPDPAKTVPADPSDSAAWKKYVAAVSKTYVPTDQSSRIFATFVEAGSDEEKTSRHIENVKNFIGRGIAEGTTLLFASPDSALMASVIERAFAEPRVDLLKGIRVIFVGQKSDEERVKAAIAPWGADFIFHEAK